MSCIRWWRRCGVEATMRRSTNAEVRQAHAAVPTVIRRSRALRWGAAALLMAFMAAEASVTLASPPFKPPPKRRTRHQTRVPTAPARETPAESPTDTTPPSDTTPQRDTGAAVVRETAAAPAQIE